MENAAIRLHKSHMCGGGHLPARSARSAPTAAPRMPGTAGPPAAVVMSDHVRGAARQGFAPACMVDASARRDAGAQCAGRVTTGTATGTAQASSRRARADVRQATDAVRAGGAPPPVREHQRGARGGTDSARCRAIGKGQEAYFAADRTGSRQISGTPWLSLHESPLSAQDLPSATLGNRLCV